MYQNVIALTAVPRIAAIVFALSSGFLIVLSWADEHVLLNAPIWPRTMPGGLLTTSPGQPICSPNVGAAVKVGAPDLARLRGTFGSRLQRAAAEMRLPLPTAARTLVECYLTTTASTEG
jgi:hypothetical protein